MRTNECTVFSTCPPENDKPSNISKRHAKKCYWDIRFHGCCFFVAFEDGLLADAGEGEEFFEDGFKPSKAFFGV